MLQKKMFARYSLIKVFLVLFLFHGAIVPCLHAVQNNLPAIAHHSVEPETSEHHQHSHPTKHHQGDTVECCHLFQQKETTQKIKPLILSKLLVSLFFQPYSIQDSFTFQIPQPEINFPFNHSLVSQKVTLLL